MPFFIRLILIVVSASVSSSISFADDVRSLDELKQQMTQLGKPALVIAGADWCVYCREMSKELATTPELQPLKREYAILKIDADTPVWAAAKRAFKFEKKGVPAVFVFRADGKQLHSGAGKPTDMHGFLKRNLEKAGLILTPAQSQILNKDIAKLQRALKKKDLAEAIKISSPYDLGKSFAQPAITMTAVQNKIKEQITEQLTSLEQKLKENPDDFHAAYELMKLKENCAGSRPLTAQVQAVHDAVKLNEKTIAQTELLLQADHLHKERKRRDENKIYQDILKQYPDTALAKIVQLRLGKKSKSDAGLTPTTIKSSQEINLKKSETYLRLAKQLLKVKSSKANKYLQKAIDAAPDSESARQAQQLLK